MLRSGCHIGGEQVLRDPVDPSVLLFNRQMKGTPDENTAFLTKHAPNYHRRHWPTVVCVSRANDDAVSNETHTSIDPDWLAVGSLSGYSTS